MIATTPNKELDQFYRTWKNINARCRNKNNPSYKYYGKRGIGVSGGWNSFYHFHQDMYQSFVDATEEYPNVKLSIERKDNNKGYSKSNCSWIPLSDQSKNRRSNHVIKYKGKTLTLAELSRKLGRDYDNVRNRIIRKGMSLEEALAMPFRNRRQPVEQRTVEGKLVKVWPTVKEAATKLGVADSGIVRAAHGKQAHCGGFLWVYMD